LMPWGSDFRIGEEKAMFGRLRDNNWTAMDDIKGGKRGRREKANARLFRGGGSKGKEWLRDE